MNRPTHTIISSTKGTLKLDDEDQVAYAEEEKALFGKYYRKTRAKYGIYAGSQDKFVKSRKELSVWDNDFEERTYAADLPDEAFS